MGLLLSACSSYAPRPSAPSPVHRPSTPERDGPAAAVPPNLQATPDAEPRIEPIRKGGPNKPYEVLGQHYEPLTDDQPLFERGLASWYGNKFHGRPTSSGEVYNMFAMTAAHATMPIPSYARVRNPANGREVIVRVNDRGPFHPGRVIDLSYTAALKLDLLRGVAPVEVQRLTFEDIRTGAWQRDQLGDAAPVYAAAEASGAPSVTSVAEMREQPFSANAATATTGAAPGRSKAAPPTSPVAPAAAPAAAANSKPAPSSYANANASAGSGSPGFWVQLGAFAHLAGAESLRQNLANQMQDISPLLAIFKEKSLHRLQAGPYPTREAAKQAAHKLGQLLAVSPVVVERR